MVTILELQSTGKSAILSVINDAARAYKGVIPRDRWKDPYMSAEEFDKEREAGVQFYGLTKEGALMGVAGIQHYDNVDLIRHCYVRTDLQRHGVGSILLRHLFTLARAPEVLVGTWEDATWAIRFYKRHGFEQVSREETDRLLERYWDIPQRQIETSIVLRYRKSVALDAL
jgi:GNAT superfamily N-acetyltransferase